VNTSQSAPGVAKRIALCVLALLVFALATYARLSWYGKETLDKRYLVKSVKLMETRTRVVVDAQLPAAAPSPMQVRPEPAEPAAVLPLPRPAVVLLIHDPTYFRPPPASTV